MTTSYINFGKTRIHYDIVRSQSKKETEIVITGESNVKVLAPENKRDEEIHKIVKSNSRWIYQKQLRLQGKKTNIRSYTYSNGSTLPYLGKEYSLYLVNLDEGKNEEIFILQKGRFVVQLTDMNRGKIRLLHEKWLEKQATNLLKKKVYNYCKVIGLDHRTLKIRIKSQKNRVGSLGRNLVLNLNKNLVHLPIKIVDYVVVHELCHVYVPDHSSNYWRLVGSVMPDYKRRKEWLEINKQDIIS